jgi:hypothetical protein
MRANDMTNRIKGACYEPQSPEEHIQGISLLLPIQDASGFVFLTAYTKKENGDSERLLQVLSEQTRRLVESFGKESNPQHRFEQFLGALNETLAEHVRDGHWTTPIEELNAIVGITSNKEMFISGTGELTALFLHKKPSQRFQVFNLFRSIQTEQALQTWEKAFAVVLDGDLHEGDVFCVTNKNIQTDIESNELNNILSTLPPVSAVEKIRQYYSIKDSAHITVIKVDDTAAATSPLTQKQSQAATPHSNVSVENLRYTEESTDMLLEDQHPSITGIIKRVKIYIQTRANNSQSRILRDLQNQGSASDITKRISRSLWRVTLIASKRALKKSKKTISTLQNKEERKHIKKRISVHGNDIKGKLGALINHTKNVNQSTKYLVIGTTVAVLVLAIGISTISKSQARSSALEAYQKQIVTIEDVMERAAGAVIYKDENQARSLYINAQTLIEDLPALTEEEQATFQELENQVQAALNEIRHLITIPNPPLLADLETLTDGVFGNGILKTDNNFYVAGSDGRIYQLNNAEKRFDVAVSDSSNSPTAIATSQEEGRLYLLSDKGELHRVSATNETIESLGSQDTNWVDLEAYASRLYILRTSQNGREGQIVRYKVNGSDISEETNWITSRTVSFDDAVSLAIDGTVFVLMSDGSIARFEGGSEVGWNTGIVDPRITAATKIWTDGDSDYVYILEPSTQRVIVFNKESGAFVVQYRSDEFTGVTDFLVDENGYTIYLLAGSKLYSIAASHIE